MWPAWQSCTWVFVLMFTARTRQCSGNHNMSLTFYIFVRSFAEQISQDWRLIWFTRDHDMKFLSCIGADTNGNIFKYMKLILRFRYKHFATKVFSSALRRVKSDFRFRSYTMRGSRKSAISNYVTNGLCRFRTVRKCWSMTSSKVHLCAFGIVCTHTCFHLVFIVQAERLDTQLGQ